MDAPSTPSAPPAPLPPNDVVMLDNYDSFTWNLYQYLCLLGANVTVIRSEALTVEELQAKHPNLTHLVISPGPGHPLTDSGISIPAIRAFAGKIPVLGVCMGLQCMYAAYGGVVDLAGEVVHGKTSSVVHDSKGLFKGVSQGIQSTRYHSLAASLHTLPDELEITSRTEAGIVMGLRHKEFTVESVQYHPESILSEEGKVMLLNFLNLKSGKWADNPGYGIGATNGVTHIVAPSAAALPTILGKIEHQRTLDVARAKITPGSSPSDLASLIALHTAPPLISFYHRLQSQSSSSPEPHVALLAEIKRASPSKGDIVDASSPSSPSIALSYALAGASVISVLTEPKWFKGSLDDMRAVRAAIDCLPNRPAVLRKDFILDTYQIDEARVYGADTVLLIVAMLTDEKLKELYDYSLSRGMEPLVEVNNADELKRALHVSAKVIGVNNRNLHDFQVDMGTTTRIADVIKEQHGHGKEGQDVILIALSGITGREDVVRYTSQGVGAVLVGESLMRASNKGAFVRELLGIKQVEAPTTIHKTLVKICGLQTPEAALVATEAGADFLGLVFVPASRRSVSIPVAQSIISAVRSRLPCTPISDTLLPKSGESSSSASSDWFSLQSSRLASHPRKPLFVGVFQNPTLELLLHTIDTLHLDAVQFHGNEPTEWARLVSVPVIRAFHVSSRTEIDDGDEFAQLKEATRPGYHSLPLLDTAVGTAKGAMSGGAGKVFDWDVAARLIESRGEGQGRLPVILAGGLEIENVQDAIRRVRPYAVDVSGGVETDKVKDHDKIRKFIEVAKNA